MKIKTKQIITGIVANVLFFPPIYVAFLHRRGMEPNWILIFISFLPLIFVLLFLRIIWGPDIYKKSVWKEEGYSNFEEWSQNSQTFNVKLIRFIVKFLMPIMFILTIILCILNLLK